MKKIKGVIKSVIKENSLLYKILKKCYHVLSKIKYKIVHFKEDIRKKRHYSNQVRKAFNLIINKYQNADYIVLYNPAWLGVANSTKGLFENIVPLEQVFGRKNINTISNAIIEAKIKKVIFSQIVDGWTDVIKKIKEKNDKLDIQVIWHANNFEVISDYTWNSNKNVLELYNKGYINGFAFVKKSMCEFYNRVGYRAKYLINNVNIKDKQIKEYNKIDVNNLKIGVYNANTRELKNVFTQLSAIKLINGAETDVVPTNEAILEFLKIIELKNTNLPDYISTEDLLKRIQKNDANIYITFTECSPMFPIESFEMGVPCLVGNNNDYFQNTKLGEYVIVDKEDDEEYISKKILDCVNHRDEIMQLYHEWKKDFDIECKNRVIDFIKG